MHKRPPLILLCCLFFGAILALNFDSFINPRPKIETQSAFCTSIDSSHVHITLADCNANNGSIVDLVGNGDASSFSWTWYDSQNNIVGVDADLNNVGPGTYRVTLADDSKCPAATMTFTVGVNNTVIFDYADIVITSPSCNATNGSITNINIAGSPTSFQWVSSNNYTKVIATTKNLINVGSGTYVLTATNAQGCFSQGRFTINPGSYAPVLDSISVSNSDCKATGTFTATFGHMQPTDPVYSFYIYNSAGKLSYQGGIAYNPQGPTVINATGFSPDTYQLVTVTGRCVTTLTTFTVMQDKFLIDTSQLVIRPNVCGRYVGVISDLHLTGTPPLALPDKLHPLVGYHWLDAGGNRVGGTLFLSGVPSGYYSLYVVNNDLCVSDTVTFFIPDSISTASRPQLNDVKMCLPGIAVLDVLNKDPNGHYQLLDSAMNLIDTSLYGEFARKVTKTTVFYVQSIDGICPSPLGKVTVEVVNPGVIIPNAFTPNGDGINDLWGITGLEDYPGTEVSVFNRIGERVYHSINYSKPFDGRYNGKPLPDGVYYYIVDTKKPDCRAGLSGSLTIIR